MWLLRNFCFFAVITFCVTINLVFARIEIDIYHNSKPVRTKRFVRAAEDGGGKKWTNETVSLYKYGNGEYYGLINVGSPAQQFKVLFDTTWADSWLPSAHCGIFEIACAIHAKYDGSKSSTYKPDGRPFNFSTSSYSLKGFLSVDNFHLAHVELPNQVFVEITHMSLDPFVYAKADGLIGLAFNTLAKTNTVPFFYNLFQQQIIKKPIFTLYMNRDATTERAGKLILGGTSRQNAKKTPTIVSVTEKKYWKFVIDRIYVDVGNKSFSFCKNNCSAIIDSSTNTISGPPDEIEEINNLINAREISSGWPHRYVVNCRDYAKLPDVGFILNQQKFEIQSKYYVQHFVLNNLEVCLSPFVPSNDGVWELGGAFLMQFYTEYDLENGRIGIAETVF